MPALDRVFGDDLKCHGFPGLAARDVSAVAGAGRSSARNGAVTASAPQTRARPRYSVSSNGPMALTVMSYVIADNKATVFPTSSTHHAQRSPRRKAVMAITLPMKPNKTQ